MVEARLHDGSTIDGLRPLVPRAQTHVHSTSACWQAAHRSVQ
jgi:hypothetical protein